MNAPRVIVTRPSPEAEHWAQALAAQGVRAQALPLIEIGPPPDPAALRAAVLALAQWQAVMFVSGNAVAGFMECFRALGFDGSLSPLGERVRERGCAAQALLCQPAPPALSPAPLPQAGEGRFAIPPSLAETPKFSGTPPTKKPGASPAHSRIHASIAVVVVLPCVPATASTWRPCRTFSSSHCGPLV
jgi:hypothetical protein